MERRRCRFNNRIYCNHQPEELTLDFCRVCQISRIPQRLDKLIKTLEGHRHE